MSLLSRIVKKKVKESEPIQSRLLVASLTEEELHFKEEQARRTQEKDHLTVQFRAWLDDYDHVLEAAEPVSEEFDKTIDLFTLFGEFNSLKSEIKLQSKQANAYLNDYKTVVEQLQSSYETLKKEQSLRREDRNELKHLALKTVIMELLDVRDRLDEGIRTLKIINQKELATIEQRIEKIAKILELKSPSWMLDIRDHIENNVISLKRRKAPWYKRMFGNTANPFADVIEELQALLGRIDKRINFGPFESIVEDKEKCLSAVRENLQDSLLENIVKGQEMILNRLDRMLMAHGVTAIQTVGRTLDPYTMRVIEVGYDEDKKDGEVLEEFRKGFMMDEDIIRVADVKVNKQPVESDEVAYEEHEED
jgi:hypothetical protein